MDRAAHFAGISGQRGFIQFAARHLGDQRDHLGADVVMRAAFGIALADHLNPTFCIENSVLATIAGDIPPLGVEELRGGLGTAGGKDQKSDQGFHALTLAGIG